MLFQTMAGWEPWNYVSSVLDIGILAYIIYQLLMLIRGTRAVQLLNGILLVFAMAVISDLLELNALNWILSQAWAVLFVAIAVIFQPELRRALEQIGRGRLFGSHHFSLAASDLTHVIDEIVAAAIACAKTKTGALMVIERETGLADYVESGIALDAAVSRELLINIFVKDTPLHDGATIIQNGRISAAACFLPLSDNPYISTTLGTRHRAGIGLSEVSDAMIIIVSAETGNISLAQDGKLIRQLDERHLRELLGGQMSSSSSSVETSKKKEVQKDA